MKCCEWVSDAFILSLTRKNGLKKKKKKKEIWQIGNQLIRLPQSRYHAHTHKGFKYTFCYECPAGNRGFQETFHQENMNSNGSILTICKGVTK